MAQALDASSGNFSGDPVALSENVQDDESVWRATMTASEDGKLMYQPGSGKAGRKLTWFDPTGKALGTVGEQGAYFQVQLSPDQKKLAINIGDPVGAIWIHDLARNLRTRLTFEAAGYRNFAWSPDGSQIAYTVARGGSHSQMYIKSSSGEGEEKPLLESNKNVDQSVSSFSPDGRYLIYVEGNSGLGDQEDLWILPLFGDRKPFPYLKTHASEANAQFSPDGRWIAYSSTESGHGEVYVAPFPWTGAKWQVSANGADIPRWRHDGKELYFLPTNDSLFTAAEVNGSGSSFEVSALHTLFRTNMNSLGWLYDTTHDGQRFIVVTAGEDSSQPLTLVQNWTMELKKK